MLNELNSGATLDVAVGNTLSVLDSSTNNGSIVGGGTVTLSGTSQQKLLGNGTYNNLGLNNSNGAIVSNTSGTMVNITGRYIPSSGTLTTNNNVTLKSSASGTATVMAGSGAGGYINGAVMIERYIPARRAWRLISFPVSIAGAPTINASLQEGAGGTASSNPNPGYGTHITGGSATNGFDQNPSGNPSMKELSGGNWIGISSTNQSITNSAAYMLFVRGSRANNLNQGVSATADNTTLRFVGNIKQGNQSLPVAGAGWQLVPNPFPSIISLHNIALANSSLINDNFKFWDPKMGGSNGVGGFVTASYNGSSYDYSPSPVSSLSEYAQTGSAFYVDAVAGGSLSITESVKCNCGNDNVFRPLPASTNQSKMRVNLLSVNSDLTTPVVDGILTVFGESFSNDIDNLDAGKLDNPGTENISIRKNNSKLSIERRNMILTDDTVNLTITNFAARSYYLEIAPENFNNTIQSAFLEDKYTNTNMVLDLGAVNRYRFTVVNVPGAYAADRFRIVFKALVVLPVTFTDVKVIVLGGTGNVGVKWKTMNQTNIKSYDVEWSSDGTNFSKKGELTAINMGSGFEYNFIDNAALMGTNYYRIKAVGTDGSTHYSRVAKAGLDGNIAGINVYQNPVKNNELLLGFESQEKGKYTVDIFDVTGSQVYSTSFLNDGIDGIKKVKVKSVAAQGQYHVRISNQSGIITTLKVIVN